ncbi:hypothetical protein HPP92_004526 [Vanilla planifolia]|uniref:BHLH domain-containing protein n=1 Tax=Vanilla planifolia TaxID=51239 RepID=A0A835RXL2_VANPL|nr:hypothetical protein HPP92_004526 [Vanilla planifolia]
MKYLQGLVPGCDKITGKAGMLDEIINYVQALQRQVEFLSMKLAAVNPWIDFNFDSFFLKELNMVGNLIIPTMEPPKQTVEPSFLGLNPMRQMPPCDGLNVSLNSSDSLFSHPSFNVQNSSWHANSQSISCADFNQEKGPIFPLQSSHWWEKRMTKNVKQEKAENFGESYREGFDPILPLFCSLPSITPVSTGKELFWDLAVHDHLLQPLTGFGMKMIHLFFFSPALLEKLKMSIMWAKPNPKEDMLMSSHFFQLGNLIPPFAF